MTEPHRATPAGATDRIAQRLVTAGYAILPRQGRLRRFMPHGGRYTHRVTYAASALSLAVALLIAKVQLWIPALVLVFAAAYLYDLADRQRAIRRRAVAAERAARGGAS